MILNPPRPRLACALAAALLGLAAASVPAQSDAAAPQPAAVFGDEVIAKAKGFEIKRGELDEAVIAFKANMAGQGRAFSPLESAQLERQLFNQLLQLRLLLTRATDADRVKGEEKYRKRFEEIKSRAASEEAFARQLKALGLSEEKLRKRLIDESTAAAVVERETNVTISEDAVKKYYEENPSKFEQPEMVRASHILISTRDPRTNTELGEDAKKEKRKQIDALLKRARDGEDFAKLAKEHTDDEASRARGGEYVFGRGQMVPEFERVAFGLKTNQISDVITTSYGYHIIKLHERLPARKFKLEDKLEDLQAASAAKAAPGAKKEDLGTVSDRVRESLKSQEIQKRLPDFMANLRKEAELEILDDRLKPSEKADEPAKPEEK